MNAPFVSCLCPTFGRFPAYGHLVEEAIESFAKQDYPLDRRELLICNDCGAQELVCDVPGVRVLNVKDRFASLGGKYNWMIEQAKGDLLCPWEDDDLSLGWRINQGIRGLGIHYIPHLNAFDRHSAIDYWKPPQVIFLDARGVHYHHAVGVRHHASIFTREAWRRVGGYPEVSGNQDALMDQRLGGHLLPRYPDGIPPAEWSYIYRWNVSPNHLSGFGDPEVYYRQVGAAHLVEGTFTLRPHWRQDYLALCRQALGDVVL